MTKSVPKPRIKAMNETPPSSPATTAPLPPPHRLGRPPLRRLLNKRKHNFMSQLRTRYAIDYSLYNASLL